MKYKLIIKNIQAIEYAEIEIDSITGIVGNNNLGKSTINKILFSLVKTKVELATLDGREGLRQIVSTYFKGEEKEKHVNKIIEYMYNGNVELNEIEKEIVLNVQDIADGFNLINKSTGFSRHLTMELTPPILRFGSEEGEIKLYKTNNLIYHVGITNNEELFDKEKTIKVNDSLWFREYCNKLLEFEYEDVTYLELNDILTMYPIWGEILVSGKMKASTKDTIRKLMKCDDSGTNDIRASENTLIYVGKKLFYKTENKLININSIGDGFKRLAQLKTLIRNSIISEKTLLLLEEPEVGIHANKLIEMVKMLEELRNIGVDIVFTTHSSLFINYVIDDANIHVATSEEQTVLDCSTTIKLSKDPKEILSQYTKPLSQLRESKFESIFERRKRSNENIFDKFKWKNRSNENIFNKVERKNIIDKNIIDNIYNDVNKINNKERKKRTDEGK